MPFVSKHCTSGLRTDATQQFCTKNWAPWTGELVLVSLASRRAPAWIGATTGNLICNPFWHRKFHTVQPESRSSVDACWVMGYTMSTFYSCSEYHGTCSETLIFASFWARCFKSTLFYYTCPFLGTMLHSLDGQWYSWISYLYHFFHFVQCHSSRTLRSAVVLWRLLCFSYGFQ